MEMPRVHMSALARPNAFASRALLSMLHQTDASRSTGASLLMEIAITMPAAQCQALVVSSVRANLDTAAMANLVKFLLLKPKTLLLWKQIFVRQKQPAATNVPRSTQPGATSAHAGRITDAPTIRARPVRSSTSVLPMRRFATSMRRASISQIPVPCALATRVTRVMAAPASRSILANFPASAVLLKDVRARVQALTNASAKLATSM